MDHGHSGGDDGPGPGAFIAILVGFKLWTLLVILLVATSWDTAGFLAATHVLWILVGTVALWGPAVLWYRLVRVRRRRRELLRAEWEVEDTQRTRR